MLGALRSFVGSWAAKILLVLLVGSFALWGVSGSILGEGNGFTVAQVGETKVEATDFLGTYNRNLNEMQQRIGRRITREDARNLGLEGQALSAVISFATIDEFARENGLALSDEMLAQMIADNPAFQDSTGKFNRDSFTRALYSAQMREADFINLQNATAIRQQVTEAIAMGEILPDTFNKAIRSYVNEERRFSYLFINPEIGGKPAEPTEGNLKTYFEENKASYAAPEYRKIGILSLEPKDIVNEDAISDDQVKDDYEARIASYSTPERRRVQQLVFKSQEAADAGLKSLKDGATFETLLEENSIKLSDADLGLVAQTALPAQLRETAFSLELNNTSDIVDGAFGPTMVRVTEIAPASVKPLEEVSGEIRKELAERVAGDEILNIQEEVEDARAGGLPLEDVAKKLKLTARTFEQIDARGRLPDGTQITDIPVSAELLRQAFNTEIGAQASPLDIGTTGFVWYDVQKIDAARDRTYDEVQDNVRTDWTRAEQMKILTQKAEAAQKEIEQGKSLKEVALSLGALDETTPFIKRNAETPDFPRRSVQAGYAIAPGKAAVLPVPAAETVLLISVLETKGAQPEAQASTVAGIEQQLTLANQGAGDDLLNLMIRGLGNRYPVTSNPAVVERVLANPHGNR